MTQYDGNVLVLGSGDRAFLAVIRSLGRCGLNVHVAMCDPDELALKSRYVAQWHQVPCYQPGDDSWFAAMESILNQTPFQLVIPCMDQAVIPLQIHQQRLAPLCRLCLLCEEAFDTAFSKIESYRLAQRLGIPQPKSAVLDADDDHEVISEFEFPVVVKPPSSFTSRDLATKRGVVRCRTKEELSKQLKIMSEWGSAIVQQNFIGTGVGVELLAYDGEVLVAFQHVRVHEPLEGGGSSYRRSAELNPEMLAASKSLIGELDYTGVAMVEFKYNFETDQWVFVEINGRFWGSLPLAIAAGVDFPRYLYEMLVHGRREFPQRYQVPVFCRNLASDQRWFRSNWRADKSDPLLATRPLRSVAAESLNVLLMRERWDTLAIDDPRPGLADLLGIMRDGVGKVTRGCRRQLDDSYPVRRWRRRRVIAKAREAKNLLFVCKGNICRSPFAEHYARSRLPAGITMQSCGYFPASGRAAPDVAQQVADHFGVDLSGHRSQIISESMIDQADLIFTFDEHNRDAVRSRFPAAAGRVFGLGVFCGNHPYRVADPYGSEASGFQAAYTQITQAIESLANEVKLNSAAVAVSATDFRRGTA